MNPVILNNENINIQLASSLIKDSSIVAIPTETVYGLAGSALSEVAINKIYDIKNRPFQNPLIIHFSALFRNNTFDIASCVNQISSNFYINDTFLLLIKKFSPGPLTFILRRKENCLISPLCSNYLPKQALRIPNHETALRIINLAGMPVVAPSANISNTLSPTSALHVQQSFAGKELTIIDGGECLLGLESTVIDITDENNINILRHGSLSLENLLNTGLEIKSFQYSAEQLLSPGMMHKHYSPKANLRLNATFLKEGEALLAFGEINFPIPINSIVLNLSKTGNLVEAGHNLFKMLWDLDNKKVKNVAVCPIPFTGLGIAINERLEKASYPIG